MFDYIVVVVTDDSDARKLAYASLRDDVLLNSTFVPVSESAWHGRAGNGFGTLFAIENASKAIGKDLVEEVKRGKSVLIVHTAGEGTRNLLTRTCKNKALIEVPNLTLLEGVIKQFQDLAIPSRILVTWGDQFLLFEDSPEDIRKCAKKTHVMLFGLKTELTEEIARTYGIQIVGCADGEGCELLDFEDTRNYEVAKMLVQKWNGDVMVNMGMFAMSGVVVERMLNAFSDALAARTGKLNSDELWQTWISPEYEADEWLRERADRLKNELSRAEPLALIKSYPLSDRTIWEDFGTNDNYYKSMMKLLGENDVGQRLREFLGVAVSPVKSGCDVLRSVYEHAEFEAGVVKDSVIANSTAKYAQFEQACVINSTLNRIRGKRCVVYNVVDYAEIEVEDRFLVDVFHPIKGRIRLTIRIGEEKGDKEKWWNACLPENEFSLSEMAEMLKGVSDDEKEDTKKRFECVAKTMISGDEELKRLVERPFKIKPFVEPKPWGYELWCASPRNYAELESETDQEFTLDDLMLLFPEQILGAGTLARDKFPLIVKIIRADENLSVQVHPDDAYANSMGDVFGKEEAWHVLEAARDAKIYLGFANFMSRTEVIEAVKRETFLSYLHTFDASVGDTYHIPAGVVHALGAGTRVYEVSTTSERTFRIYDYGRGRELHLKDAMNVLKLDAYGRDLQKESKIVSKERGFEEYPLLRGDHFQLRLFKVHGDVNISTERRLWVVTCVQGQVTLKTEANEIDLRPPETVVVPACVEKIDLAGKGEVICARFIIV
ncbi:MAG TPA: type I phosphomannose isomerase catalytic subunit [Candidatus Bathyarchaeia archaeon]|nr:type I phosphomannose isomerase catalytic subunit [Candidatus Bathyarchaeia archaeon]